MRSAVLGLAMLVVAPRGVSAFTEVHYVMGTYFRITAEGPAARPAARRCFREARRLEGVFSRFDPQSELSRVNATAGAVTRVSGDFARLLARARVLGTASDHAFDVTVGPLTALWRGATAPPDTAAVALARSQVGDARIRLDGERLHLKAGTRLDFDGIAKGRAVDACVDGLRAAGVRSALVSLGESSLYALGRPADAPDWTLAVRGADPQTVVGRLHLRDSAASVSATFGDRGPAPGKVGHIIDPRSGRPLTEAAVAIVVAHSATDAEAWSKAVLLWGRAGPAHAERAGVAAVLIAPEETTVGTRARRTRVFEPMPTLLVAGDEALP